MKWFDQAHCKGMPLSWYFEDYEDDKEIAEQVDQICFDCPVRKECLKWAVDSNSTGVFGGVYLVLGKYNKTKNSHKYPYISNKLQKEVGEI